MHKIIEATLRGFKDFFEFNEFFLSPFIFRGQENPNWELKTSIERTIDFYSDFEYEKTEGYETQEKWMLYEFKKKFPLYANKLPKHNDNFEWLAIMQHYGSPTRLLDFSNSIFVSLYFATINTKKDSSIWCLNQFQIKNNLHTKFNLEYFPGVDLKDIINDKHIEFANKFIGETKNYGLVNEKSLIPLEPNFLTERLSKQQGLFLMPTQSQSSFMENMIGAFNLENFVFHKIDIQELIEFSQQKSLKHDLSIIKLNIPEEVNYEAVKYLQDMNINAETLFPGIDGLAKSLIQTRIRL